MAPISLLVKSKAFNVLQGLYISNLSFSPAHSTPATMAVLLFLEHAGHKSASGPLHCLFPLPGIFFSQMNVAYSLTAFKSLLKCHLLDEAYFDHPISGNNLHPLYPALFVSLPTPSNILHYLLIYYA